jgi:hypothetical protein
LCILDRRNYFLVSGSCSVKGFQIHGPSITSQKSVSKGVGAFPGSNLQSQSS